MRIRVNDPVHDWINATVIVEGAKISNCIAADTDEGWADIIATDDAGNALVDGDHIKTERLTGTVAVTFPQVERVL